MIEAKLHSADDRPRVDFTPGEIGCMLFALQATRHLLKTKQLKMAVDSDPMDYQDLDRVIEKVRAIMKARQ